MIKKELFPPQSIFFAPMEGVTNALYRESMAELFPEWDFYFTEFIRIPTTGYIGSGQIIDHIGKKIYDDPVARKKNILQILSTVSAKTEQTIDIINQLSLDWIDFNLGCPSKKVNLHGGGAHLLGDLKSLSSIIKILRQNFPGILSVKMRVGYKDDNNFIEIIKMLEGEGIDLLTIHARTQAQQYDGKADWQYIATAVATVKIPIIGNGDIWSIEDIDQIFEQTDCHSIMIGRGALKTPWLSELYRKNKSNNISLTARSLLDTRTQYIWKYFSCLQNKYSQAGYSEAWIMRHLKALCRNIFDDFPHGQEIKESILRSNALCVFEQILRNQGQSFK